MPGPVRALAANRDVAGWVEGLPALVTELERAWGITVGRAYGDSTEAWVAEAVTAAGTPAVVKVFVPGRPDKAAYETTVLRLAGGQGCVRLLDARPGALLLERLGPSLSRLGLGIRERHEILCAAAEALWRPAPDAGLPTGATKARAQVTGIPGAWEALGRPCSEAAVAQAVAAAGRRADAHDDERAVLLHGDVHQWNTLRTADGTGYALVDPDGLLGERELDLGVLLREDLEDVTVGDLRDRAARIAARTGTDPAAIWDWGLVERMSNGLACLVDGLEHHGRISLALADRAAAGT